MRTTTRPRAGQCQRAIELDPNEPAAYYLAGCAYLRENQPEKAVQAFQQSQKIDPAVDALAFQLGLAQNARGTRRTRFSNLKPCSTSSRIIPRRIIN